MLTMRRKRSVKCFVYFIGVPVTFWFVIHILYWNFELSSNARNNPGRIRIKARKIRGMKEDPGNSDYNTQTEEKLNHNNLVKIVDKTNVALVKKYDINILNELGIIKTPNDQKLRDEGTRQHAFNQLISDRIGFHRSLPDSRNKLCHNKSYPVDLPDASIIICFYNEAVSALLRTVYSVIDRTPSRYLREILLVDDSSDIGMYQVTYCSR
ncbi:hypothetical protein KUTeg_008238 [Tegillarca granosa]|uniref:Glycosyltransferase 2-like domain-containing protein n=1 Tax=Tegillarca granosa TaxID=220873 RepID=A0ABQ9FCW1_TEGGR|nr:hypothetical protein KUTeg_008238 [Tegillarca granosa]